MALFLSRFSSASSLFSLMPITCAARTLVIAGAICAGVSTAHAEQAATQPAAKVAKAPSTKPLNKAKIALGKRLFFDPQLSEPIGQSCATCHDPQKAFSDPNGTPISPGARPGLFGSRNAPSLAYSKMVPPLHFDAEKNRWIGGQFWDGRVDTLAEQAILPLTNPLEMNHTISSLVAKLNTAPYAKDIIRLYGPKSLAREDSALAAITDALASYQQGPEFALFTSKYDLFVAGKLELSPQEQRGLFVFQDNGKCMDCHLPFNPDHSRTRAPLSDFSYHNLGVPRNPNAPFLSMAPEFNPAGVSYVDFGLGANGRQVEGDISKMRGRFRTPSLRNVAITAPYMHNGIFKTLREVVEFYSTRDVSDRWGPPEVKENVDTTSTGNLHLSDTDVAALVAFMETLTDGYQPTPAAVAK